MPRGVGGVARPAPRAIGKLSLAQRDELLANCAALPVALRCPPIRSVSAFVLSRLATADGSLDPRVEAWLADEGNRLTLEALLKAYRLHMKEKWTASAAVGTFNNMTRQTLLGLQPDAPKDDKYSVARRLRRLHDAKEAAVKRAQHSAEEASFRALCLCDHYDERQPGPWYQLHLLYRLALKLEGLGVLDSSPRAEADCPICLAKIDAPGQIWAHLEPCRHWMCDPCATAFMLERDEHRCPHCRADIAIFVRAVSGV